MLVENCLRNWGTFAVHYQFFRELLLALEEGGVFVLLSDARSPVFFQDGPQGPRGLMPVVMSLLPDHVRRRVVLVTVQEVLEQIVDPPEAVWVPEFRRKYGLESTWLRCVRTAGAPTGGARSSVPAVV
jgi:hypothetical protein